MLSNVSFNCKAVGLFSGSNTIRYYNKSKYYYHIPNIKALHVPIFHHNLWGSVSVGQKLLYYQQYLKTVSYPKDFFW
jgi:hypothetical protein